MTFGSLLARYRRERRMSQMDLSAASSVSQRHISFLESGRARPGTATVKRLSTALKLDFAAENALYESGGFKSPRPEFSWDDPRFKAAREVLQTLLDRHSPNPALATRRNGDVLMTNSGFDSLLNWSFEGRNAWHLVGGRKVRNLFRLTLHPAGLLQFMRNPEEVVPHTLRRIKQAAADDSAAREVLDACLRLQPVAHLADLPEPPASAASSVLVEQYDVRGHSFSFVSMVASFGCPEDITAQTIQIELFFPADQSTAHRLQHGFG